MHKCKNCSSNYDYLSFNNIQNCKIIKKNTQIEKKDYIYRLYIYRLYRDYIYRLFFFCIIIFMLANLKFYKIERNFE